MSRKIVSVFVFILVFSVAFQVITAAANTPTWSVKEGDTIVWQVKSAPNSTFVWWDINTGVVEVNVTTGSRITLNITKVGLDEVYGDFSIGNLTAKNVSMITIGFNIIIGIWPFVLGPVEPTNMWDNITAKAKEANVQTIKEDNLKSYLGFPRETIEFANTTESSGSFDVVYDKNSGILLYCYGEFGGYSITFEIVETTVNLSISSAFINMSIGGVGIAVVIIAIILYLKLKKK